jgi:hypothetical protein
MIESDIVVVWGKVNSKESPVVGWKIGIFFTIEFVAICSI